MPPMSISILREHQKQCRQLLGIVPQRTEKEVLDLTLKQAKLREEQSVPEGEFIRVGVFKYSAQLEKVRWQRTRDVIQRVMPGVDEGPVYLEMLARQAASIEIILRQEHTNSPNPKGSALCDRVLLGTAADLDPSAFAGPAGDHVIVVLSDGLISFLYQAAKAVVLSWRQVKAKPGSAISLSPAPVDIEHVLKSNPYPLDLLYKTLYEYLFNGHPRAIGYDPPPMEYIPALLVVINHSERFVIAHEYGHALLHQLASIDALPPEHASWPKEFEADSFAFVFNVISARELDQLPPNVALQGGLFALSAFDVLRKTLDIVRFGEVHKDEGDETHPPTQQRIGVLKQLYQRQVGTDVKYNLPIEGQLGQRKTIDLAIEGALVPSNTLDLLWNHIQQRFLEARQQGLKLHPIWGKN